MKNTKNFASRWGFILASVGSAVGMANVWGFPNKLGSNGGGAFLLIYLLFVFIFSYVGLPAEFAMGRHAATGTLGAYEKAWSTRGKGAGKAGGLLGWLPLAGSLCIAFGYAVIVTYILKALVDSLVGTLMTTDTASWFGTFSSTPYSVIPYHIIVVVGTLLTLYLGAHSIEKTNKIMMPLFFLIFVVLAVRVALLPGSAEGYKFMFTPRWEALKDPMIWIWAMGQAFFSLSVTGSGMIVYGAYLSKDEDVVGVAQHTALFDTIAAVVAALVIIPACFSYGVDVKSGPALIFMTLPNVFNNLPAGRFWGSLFFLFMTFAAYSTVLAVFENIVSCVSELTGLSRKKTCLVCGIALFLLSLPCLLGYNLWSNFRPIAGRDVLDSEDFLVSNLLLPLGSLLFIIFCTTRYGWGWENFLAEANEGKGLKIAKWLRPYMTYVLPVIVSIILIFGLYNFFAA